MNSNIFLFPAINIAVVGYRAMSFLLRGKCPERARRHGFSGNTRVNDKSPQQRGSGGVQRSVHLAMLGVLSAIRPPLREIRVLRRCVGQGLPLWATAGCLLRLRACGAGLFIVVLQAHRAWSCRVLRYFIAAGAAIKLAASAFRSAIAASRRRAGGCDPAGAGALPSRSGRSRLRSRRRHAGR